MALVPIAATRTFSGARKQHNEAGASMRLQTNYWKSVQKLRSGERAGIKAMHSSLPRMRSLPQHGGAEGEGVK